MGVMEGFTTIIVVPVELCKCTKKSGRSRVVLTAAEQANLGWGYAIFSFWHGISC